MRKLVAALVALAIGLMLPFATPGTAQAAGKKVKVSISVPKTVNRYSNITIKGKIRPAQATTVEIQKKWPGKKWKKIATVTSAADGAYSYTYYLTESSSRKYRAHVPRSAGIKAAYSRTVNVKVVTQARSSASVSITATGATTLTAGDNFVVSGTTSANLIGKTVVLEVDGTSGWSDLTSATVAGNATFSLSAPATLAGSGQVLKVYAPATPTTYYAESGTAAFTVYGWYYLGDRSKVEDGNRWGGGSYTINGTTYAKSVAVAGPWSNTTDDDVQYNLERRCTRFTAMVGWDDGASSSSVATGVNVYKDSVLGWNRTNIRFGSATPVDIDISGALRLKLERITSWEDQAFVFGDARILCAF